VDILRWRAAHQADRRAYVFARGEGQPSVELTYATLDRRARAVAASLAGLAAHGDRALLLHPTGPDFVAAFFGCLYAGVVAIPAFPPRAGRGLSRLQGIVEDAGASVVLGPAGVGLAGLPGLADEDVDARRADTWVAAPPSADDVAYLQYTSGSTSAPRGVVVTHANLLYNCAYMREVFELSADTVSVTWLPHFHDLGLIEGLLNPLYNGYPTRVLPPAQFVARPLRWLQAITRDRVTHTGAPNFAYDLCVRAVRPEERALLDLSSWVGAYCGAEPVRRATLDRFAEYFAPCGFAREAFHPAYGLAECTLMVTGGVRADPPVYREVGGHTSRPRTLVGCGRARRRTAVAIVDPETRRRQPDRVEGEIWVAGPTVARGYWNRGEQNRETFQARTSDTDEGPFLRTGDLGVLEDGELFITGRLKDLIIVRGANIYPQDVEWIAADAHAALRPGAGAAFSIEVDDEERLVVVHEVERRHRKAAPAELAAIAAAVREAVAEAFEIEVHAVALLEFGALPKTSSGKVRRQACAADFLAGRLAVLGDSGQPVTAPRPAPRLGRARLAAMPARQRGLALEEHLRRQVARGLSIPWRQVDPRRGLGSYGLTSLRTRELIAELEDELELKLSSSTLFNYPTIAELSAHVLRRIVAGGEAGDARDERDERGVP
jgi:acyl-CoA synthetase (AMP-forming)/AMP-acid ligase II